MVDRRKRLVPTIAVTSLLLGSAALANGISHAEQAVLIPGATVFKRINPIYSTVAESYPVIGIHFHDDADPQIVQYSQNALDSDRAIQDGVVQAGIAIRRNDGKVVIIGESMGSMVAWRAAKELAESDDAPPVEDVRVVLIAPPEAGVAEYFKAGTYIPVLNYRITRIADLPYATTVVIGEYDGWADPPDRPWNLLASANAMAGIAYVHGPPIAGVDLDQVAETTTTDGNVTTHFVPTEHLPLTQVFRDVGVPDTVVDKADDVLRPVIDSAYVRHDEPGDTRPYLYDGAIHRNVQSQQQARESTGAISEKASTVAGTRRDHRADVRRVVNTVRDRVDAGISQLKDRIAEGRAILRKREPEPEPK